MICLQRALSISLNCVSRSMRGRRSLGILGMGSSGTCKLKQKLFPNWKKFLFYFSQSIIMVMVLTNLSIFAKLVSQFCVYYWHCSLTQKGGRYALHVHTYSDEGKSGRGGARKRKTKGRRSPATRSGAQKAGD